MRPEVLELVRISDVQIIDFKFIWKKIKTFKISNFFLRFFRKKIISGEFRDFSRLLKYAKRHRTVVHFETTPSKWPVLMGLRCIHTDVSHFSSQHFFSASEFVFDELRIETSCHFSTVETLKCNRRWRHLPTSNCCHPIWTANKIYFPNSTCLLWTVQSQDRPVSRPSSLKPFNGSLS